jgi:hypothetical protein
MLSGLEIYIKILEYKNEKQSGPYIQNKRQSDPCIQNKKQSGP